MRVCDIACCNLSIQYNMSTYVIIISPEIYTTSRLVDDVINHVRRNIVIYHLYDY